jgi:hypothetical protein
MSVRVGGCVMSAPVHSARCSLDDRRLAVLPQPIAGVECGGGRTRESSAFVGLVLGWVNVLEHHVEPLAVRALVCCQLALVQPERCERHERCQHTHPCFAVLQHASRA